MARFNGWFRVAAALLAAGGLAGCGELDPQEPKADPAPVVATLAADAVTFTGATLHGSVGTSAGTTAWFEWGTDAALSGATATAAVAIAPGGGGLALPLDALAPGTTYYFRAVAAHGASSTVPGSIESFTTDAPLVATLAPDAVTGAGATLHGSVLPGPAAAEAWFEWGTDPSLAASVETAHVPVGAGGAEVPFDALLDGLDPNVTYYYRAVASDGSRTNRGAVDWFGTAAPDATLLVVNTTVDVDPPPPGKLTLRAAIAQVDPGGTITFAPGLDGQTIALSIVGEPHAMLKGEVFTFAAGTFTFEGFLDRDYGRSALYAAKDLVVDASALPHGVAVEWTGGEENPARVLAVLGNLTLSNVTLRGGHALAEPLAGGSQPFTLGRGGGLAVWGTATLRRCTIAGNRATGDLVASRDRGAFGGGLYANLVAMEDSIVAGNAAKGFGAAGGGVYSVGGPGTWETSVVARSTVSGNRVTGEHAYGGGVYTDGGGPGNANVLRVETTTVARNVVEDHPDVPEDSRSQYYYRGGGIYMSNGHLEITASTIAENAVTGIPAVFRGKPNMGGGGVAATIGDAHVVENIQLQQSIIAGNLLGGAPQDLYTGSLVDFFSLGYNLVGAIDFSQMLVPAPWWWTLSRRHWPKPGDQDRIAPASVLALDTPARDPALISVGVDAGEPVVLWYAPAGQAVDRVPEYPYPVQGTYADYTQVGPVDDFLVQIVEHVRQRYGDQLGPDFGAGLGDPTGVTFYGPGYTWPSNPENTAWISFWKALSAEIGDRLGPVQLGDYFWASLPNGPFGDNVETMTWTYEQGVYTATAFDQLGAARPSGARADVGAVELVVPGP